MKNHIIVMPKKHIIRVTLICAVIIFAASFICNFHDHQVIAVLSTSMWKIEPETPKNIDDSSFGIPYPTKTVPVSEVMENGKEIPLQFAYNNPDWQRQMYKEYWHSSYGRWSYIPNRIHYAMHRIFVTYPTASVFYDFTHNLGIWDENDDFQIMSSTSTPFENMVLVVMQTKVDKIVTLGNQVVVIGRPSLNGLQVLLIPTQDLNPYDPKESILFQLVTPEGDEIDYTNDIYAVTESSQVQSN